MLEGPRQEVRKWKKLICTEKERDRQKYPGGLNFYMRIK